MARYNLNEILKKRGMVSRPATSEEMALDDVARVKVLSPGMQVFKRFIRNRLAVFGFCLLATMFLLAFAGPLFYAYGQKDVFYKFDTQNIDYAMAKENPNYTGYDVAGPSDVERAVATSMNSNIKSMVAAGVDTMVVKGTDADYTIEKLAENVFLLNKADTTLICSVGSSVTKVGTYYSISKEIRYEIPEIDGLLDAAKKNVKGNSGSFEFGGYTYTYEKGSEVKSVVLYQNVEGVNYASGTRMDAGFGAAAEAAAETGENFSYNGTDYYLVNVGQAYEVYKVNSAAPVQVFTRYTPDTYHLGASFSEELMVNALLAARDGGSIQADGRSWTVTPVEEGIVITDDTGAEYGELSVFTVRRYNGEDSMAYDLKKAIAAAAEEMVSRGAKETTLVYDLPSQTETGEYNRDADGNIVYAETEMRILQRQVGSYVINCDQIIYVIDRFAGPSFKHILGTDGDGFDVFARIMYGGRVSLMVGFVVVFLETFLGVIMGGIAGYYGKWIDNIIMRMVDIFYCLPGMPIMIILGAMMDAMRMDVSLRLWIMMAALGVMGWAGIARLVRGQILSLREQEFMVATEATGVKVKDRIFHHLVPNVMPQLIVSATMGMGSVILTESTLSFLGLGVKHPLATWGTMINSVSSASAMAHYTFIWIPVGLLICLTVIAFNFVGDGLRDAYDPKAKR